MPAMMKAAIFVEPGRIEIVDAYDLFSHQRDGVLKIALEVS